MPILGQTTYPKIFPAGYSGSQVLRWALKDGSYQKLYPAGDAGLYSHGNLGASILGYSTITAQGSLGSSITGHLPSNLTASIAAVRCQSLGPKSYFIGYDSGEPQFLETKQEFRCVDFLSARLRSLQQSTKDITAEITGLEEEFFHGQKDLSGFIRGAEYGVIGGMTTAITGVRCQQLSPKQYFIGYDEGVPQFLGGRPIYRCVDFLPAFIRAWKTSQEDLPSTIRGWTSSQADLGSFIIAGHEIFSEYRDLTANIVGGVTHPSSLGASVVGSYCQALTPKAYFIGYDDGVPQYVQGRQRYRCVDFLGAIISKIFSEDLPAYIFAQPREFRDLGGFLRQMYPGDADLPAFLNALQYIDLPAELHPVPPQDLPGYLKVWPMGHLPGHIHGWQQSDLGAFIDWNDMRQLPAYVAAHPPKNITALIKGWVREATFDLAGWIRALQYEGLSGYIRGTYLENLTAYVFCIEPEDLSGFIHGWDTKDLPAYLNGKYGPNDLQAYINITGEPKDLPAYIKAAKAVEVSSDLTAYLYPATILMQQGDLALSIAAHSPGNLGAYLTPQGYTRSLSAFINPKMIFMTAALSVVTMEHSNLGGIINFICRGSGHKDMSATMEFSYLKELAAQITGKDIPTYEANLGATVGYAASYVHADRIPVSLTIGTGYRIEDKIPIVIDVYKQRAYLSATITGTYVYTDMGATLTPVWLQEYEFDNIKVRELVYDLNHAKQVNWYNVVELYFQTIVPEYFWVEAENKVYKYDITNRWKIDVASYIPEDIELNVRRKLHRLKTLYDLSKFNNLDEAIRFAIHYVTSYDSAELSSMIKAVGTYSDLACRIVPKYFTPENDGLSASISPQPQKFILGYDDRAEFV